MLVDYHVHAAAHGEFRYTQEWLIRYLDQAYQLGIREVGFSEHDQYAELVDHEILQKVQTNRRHGINIKLGVEIDYIPGREQIIKEIISRNAYDYTIGSVHYIDGWGFDHPDFQGEFTKRDIDEVYSQYADLLIKMTQSGYFDIVGHIDLVKIWGHRPQKQNSLYYLEPVLKVIKERGMVVEINSAGLRKKVAELYPAADLLQIMFSYNIPITFGSDAHQPEQIGEGLQEACLSARQAGYRCLVRFSQRKKMITPIEY